MFQYKILKFFAREKVGVNTEVRLYHGIDGPNTEVHLYHDIEGPNTEVHLYHGINGPNTVVHLYHGIEGPNTEVHLYHDTILFPIQTFGRIPVPLVILQNHNPS